MVTSTAKAAIPLFSSQIIEGISKVLGDTTGGLKGSEIGHSLNEYGVPDPTPGITKWQRLFNALAEDQNKCQIGTHVMQFIVKAMNPARYTAEPVLFRIRLDRLNSVLAFAVYKIAEKAKVKATDSAGTISDALDWANWLHSALAQRFVHAEVLRFCRAEIFQENYCHAVFKAMKRVTAKICRKSGLSMYGLDLVHRAFGPRSAPYCDQPVTDRNPERRARRLRQSPSRDFTE